MSERFDKVVAIMAQLRAPGGCPWDRKQTHESLKPYLIEETYEALDTIDRRDFPKLKEELGDVLLQVLFHSQIGAEAGTFTMDEVLEQLGDKLVRRHPHVFGDAATGAPSLNSDQVVHRWEDIKRAERKNAGKPDSVLHDIPQALPALLRAYQTQVRAARVGFDWPDSPQGLAAVLAKVEEEIGELRKAVSDAAVPGSVTPTPGTESVRSARMTVDALVWSDTVARKRRAARPSPKRNFIGAAPQPCNGSYCNLIATLVSIHCAVGLG